MVPRRNAVVACVLWCHDVLVQTSPECSPEWLKPGAYISAWKYISNNNFSYIVALLYHRGQYWHNIRRPLCAILPCLLTPSIDCNYSLSPFRFLLVY